MCFKTVRQRDPQAIIGGKCQPGLDRSFSIKPHMLMLLPHILILISTPIFITRFKILIHLYQIKQTFLYLGNKIIEGNTKLISLVKI